MFTQIFTFVLRDKSLPIIFLINDVLRRFAFCSDRDTLFLFCVHVLGNRFRGFRSTRSLEFSKSQNLSVKPRKGYVIRYEGRKGPRRGVVI